MGSAAAVGFMRTWVAMQGFTLASDLVAAVLILLLAWYQTRRYRGWTRPADYRRLFKRSVLRLAAWGLAGYMVYMAVITPLLTLMHFSYAH